MTRPRERARAARAAYINSLKEGEAMTHDGVSSDEVRGQAFAVAWCFLGGVALLVVGFVVGCCA